MDVTLKDKQQEAVVSRVHERIRRFHVFSHWIWKIYGLCDSWLMKSSFSYFI